MHMIETSSDLPYRSIYKPIAVMERSDVRALARKVLSAMALASLIVGCSNGNSNGHGEGGKQGTNSVPEVRQIVPAVAVNAEHDLLAVLVGTADPGQVQQTNIRAHAIVVDLSRGAKDQRVLPRSSGATSVTWRPGSDHLFLIVDFERVLRYGANDPGSLGPEIKFPSDSHAFIGGWNASGSILALIWIDFSLDLPSGKLETKLAFLSDSSDWELWVTDVRVADRRMTWVGDTSLYIESSGVSGYEILELEVSNSEIRTVRSVAKAAWLDICGAIDGDVIFHDGQMVYRDSDAIYTSLEEINAAKAGGSLVALRTTGGIVVLSSEGEVIAETRLDPDVILAAISPSANQLYLITKERTRIERMSALTLRESEVVYSVYEE